mmetsp:Transcript_3684/g.5445  ORF Transcript_3684/g.5445 Transcript_3684/m.5445 type:complete len:547 (-) Transcript_3684:9-1649(-)
MDVSSLLPNKVKYRGETEKLYTSIDIRTSCVIKHKYNSIDDMVWVISKDGVLTFRNLKTCKERMLERESDEKHVKKEIGFIDLELPTDFDENGRRYKPYFTTMAANDQNIYCGTSNGHIVVLERKTGKKVLTLNGEMRHQKAISHMNMIFKGKYLVTAGLDKKIKFWNTKSYALEHDSYLDNDYILSMCNVAREMWVGTAKGTILSYGMVEGKIGMLRTVLDTPLDGKSVLAMEYESSNRQVWASLQQSGQILIINKARKIETSFHLHYVVTHIKQAPRHHMMLVTTKTIYLYASPRHLVGQYDYGISNVIPLCVSIWENAQPQKLATVLLSTSNNEAHFIHFVEDDGKTPLVNKPETYYPPILKKRAYEVETLQKKGAVKMRNKQVQTERSIRPKKVSIQEPSLENDQKKNYSSNVSSNMGERRIRVELTNQEENKREPIKVTLSDSELSDSNRVTVVNDSVKIISKEEEDDDVESYAEQVQPETPHDEDVMYPVSITSEQPAPQAPSLVLSKRHILLGLLVGVLLLYALIATLAVIGLVIGYNV